MHRTAARPRFAHLPQCDERPGRSLPQCTVPCPNTPDRLRIEWGRRFARDSMPRCAERPGRSLPRDPPPTINATRTGPLLHGFPPHTGRIDEDRGRKGLGEHSGSGEDAHLARSAARGAPSARVDDVVGEQPVHEAAAGTRRATRRSTLHPTRHSTPCSTPCATRSALRPKFRFTRCYWRPAGTGYTGRPAPGRGAPPEASSVAKWTPPLLASCSACVRHEKPSARYTAPGSSSRAGNSDSPATPTDTS